VLSVVDLAEEASHAADGGRTEASIDGGESNAM
jgi:hypothetical protein